MVFGREMDGGRDRNSRYWQHAFVGDAARCRAAAEAIAFARQQARQNAEREGMIGWVPEEDGTCEHFSGHAPPATRRQIADALRGFYEAHHEDALLATREMRPREIAGLGEQLRRHGADGGAMAVLASRMGHGFVSNPVLCFRLQRAVGRLDVLRATASQERVELAVEEADNRAKLLLDLTDDVAAARAALPYADLDALDPRNDLYLFEELCLQICILDFRNIGVGFTHGELVLGSERGSSLPHECYWTGGEHLRAFAEQVREERHLPDLVRDFEEQVHDEWLSDPSVSLEERARLAMQAHARAYERLATVACEAASRPGRVLVAQIEDRR